MVHQLAVVAGVFMLTSQVKYHTRQCARHSCSVLVQTHSVFANDSQCGVGGACVLLDAVGMFATYWKSLMQVD